MTAQPLPCSYCNSPEFKGWSNGKCPYCGALQGSPSEITTPDNVKEVCLYAWLGEDEFGSGVVGVKQALVPAGMIPSPNSSWAIPLVAIDQQKIDQGYILKALQGQANVYGKTIRLCKFVFVEEVVTLEPST